MALTYNDLYLQARRTLRENGISGWDLEARLILCTAAGKTKEKFFRDINLYVNGEFEEKVAAMMQRRLSGEPLAYITGEWEFCGLPIEVTPDVLIPRNDTEVLAETAIRLAPKRLRVLDLCAGSGCVGIAIGAMLPGARVVLADISQPALSVARRNVLRNMLTARASCVAADALERPPMLLGSFDMIVSNPPYVRTEEIKTLDASVADYEPHLALDGGEDGLKFYRKIASLWKRILRPEGRMLFECGEDQADQVCEILSENGFRDIEKIKDMQGIDRVVAAKA